MTQINLRNPLLTLTLLMGALPAMAAEKNFTAKVFPLEGGTELLFTTTRQYTVNGDKISALTQFHDAKGVLATEETTEMQGTKVLSHYLTQHQVGERGSVVVDGKEIVFKYFKDGKEKESREKDVENFVVGVNLVPYLKTHWDEILAGKTVSVRYGALERRETVGFDFFKTGEEDIGGKKHLVVKMKPSSFVIAALVDPLNFYFDLESRELTELKGRILPKRLEGDKWKDFDGHVKYTYEGAPTPPATKPTAKTSDPKSPKKK
jgi:hypothetical protein